MKVRDLLPRNAVDGASTLFALVMIPVGYLHGVFTIAPTVFPVHGVPEEVRQENLSGYYWNVGLMTYLLINSLANYWLVVATDTSCRRVALPVVSQPGWEFCPHCQHHSPPLSHHCGVCRQCILRHDHHCFFTGKCVGHHNQRFFFAFLVNVTIAAVYATVMSFWAVSILVGGFSLVLVPAMVFPVLAWLLGVVPVNPVIMFETSIALLTCTGAGGMLALQLYQLYHGVTFHQLRRGRKGTGGRSFFGNMESALGSRWWACWVFPCIPSPLPSDGLPSFPLGLDMANRDSTASRFSRKVVKNA